MSSCDKAIRDGRGTRPLRVVHVSPTDVDGGAARGAYNLHVALKAAGVDSLMLVQRKYSDDATVLNVRNGHDAIYDGLRDRLDRLPLKLYRHRREGWWTVGWLPNRIGPVIRRLQPDVVQFHWAGRGAVPNRVLKRLKGIPMVWTLRDMWPLTGGCHYSNDCEKFLEGCGACPQLGSKLSFDLSRWQWQWKYDAAQDVEITYVALSNWMADFARRSPLTFGNEVCVIPNGVDIDRYAPVDSTLARSIWRLPTDRRIVMFGAINSTKDRRKGFQYYREAMEKLAAEGWRDRAVAVIFGSGPQCGDVGLPTYYVGTLQDNVSLSLLYACADVMVVPSVQENFGKTAIEAMASGVPVVAFANTGQVDIVDHRKNGYLAENLSSDDLAAGVQWCLDRLATSSDLSHEARSKAVREFDMRRIAIRHIELYRRLLGQHGCVKVSEHASETLGRARMEVSS